ncbi:tetratricopeptide repeat protein [Lentzea sp. CA-135723]|uniref:tetratricopeptide repeat protein n=1 Tax=Lentzea sp. CA-135723 TaxID=3239950 RepID=UPI003D8FB357
MKRLWAFRVWHGVVSVLVAAGVGVATNLATDAFSWALSSGLVALVLVQAGLSVWQAVEDQRDRRNARDELLGLLRPPLPPPPVSDKFPAERDCSVLGVGAVVGWVTAPFTPTPLWGRSRVRDRLVAWCIASGAGADVVRMVIGPAGVGKSRLALAVAEALPAGWAAGRLTDNAAGLVERIVAAGDRTLVIVDDAERVAASAVETLVTGAVRHPDLIRVLLLARTDAALRLLSDEVRPRLAVGEVVGPVGEAGDRQRWFIEASRAYAHAWRVPAPDLPDRPVGTDGDTPLVLHARALLAVLGRSGIRTWSLTDLMTELVSLEQRSWQSDLRRLPAGCDTELLAEALTVLLLLPASGVEEAAELLRRVPQFSHDTARESRVALARWARRRYPPGPDHRLGLQPHLAGERLVLDTLTRTPNLLRDEDIPAAASVLTFAYASFPDALDHLIALLARRPDPLPDALTSVLATGVTGHHLDHALASLINPHCIDVDLRTRLIALDHTTALPHLRLALTRLRLKHFQLLLAADPGRYRPDLAQSLHDLAVNLWALGWYREALAAAEEAVGIRRQLVEAEPDRYRPDLAQSLNGLGRSLEKLGRHREALAAAEEAVGIWRQLVEAEPDRYRPDLAQSLHRLGRSLMELGRHREGMGATEEAVGIWRQLVEAEPDRYRPDLALSLNNLGSSLWELGWHREGMGAAEEAVGIWRQLVEAEPDRYRPDLALSLNNLGSSLWELGWHREGMGAAEEAVGIWRQLVEAEPDRYRPDLALSLHNLVTHLWALGRHREALAAAGEAVGIRRQLVEAEPHRHRPDLALFLNGLGSSLWELGRHREALEATEEAVGIRRQLVEAEPDRHRPDLAQSLNGLGSSLWELGRHREALEATEEAVGIRRQLVEAEPDRHRPDLAHSLHNLGGHLRELGRHREALEATEEAVGIRRQLVEAEPDRHRPDLAHSLHGLSTLLFEAEDVDNALSVFGEALTVWRACAEQDPQQYEAHYRRELARLRKRLDLRGRHDEAAALDLGASDIPDRHAREE